MPARWRRRLLDEVNRDPRHWREMLRRLRSLWPGWPRRFNHQLPRYILVYARLRLQLHPLLVHEKTQLMPPRRLPRSISDGRMLKTIEQSVHFSAAARELYDIYLDPLRDAAVTGAPVKIMQSPAVNLPRSTACSLASRSSPFQVSSSSRLAELHVSRHRSRLHPHPPFRAGWQAGRIDLVHANVPEHDHAGVTEGWEKYYWKPLRAYLKKSSV